MRGKTGAARIALATGCPVIPVGQWGAQEILPPYAKKPRPVPAQAAHLKAGDPVDLGRPAWPAGHHRGAAARPPTRIMAAITAIVEELRGETAPTARFDPRATGMQQIGNPNTSMKKNGRRSMTKVAVFGAGSWGTAFSIVLADAGNDVAIWGAARGALRHDQRDAREPRLPAGHRAAADASARPTTPRRRCAGADVVVLAMPSQTLRENLDGVGALHRPRRRAGVA